jgi:metallo-beta-lactamase family protein
VSGLRKVFLVHGEPSQSETLAQLLHKKYGLEAVCPVAGETFDLT